MGMIKGQLEHQKFKDGKNLTRKQAMLALCFECNGFEESNEDCKAKMCAIYQYHPHKGKRASKMRKMALLDDIK